MKKQMFTLMALLALAIPIIGQTTKMVEFPSVYLNPNTSIQRTITHKDEKSGVKNVQKILGIENYEQGWIFIPNHSNPDSSQWINITEKMYANGEGFAVDTLQLEKIMKTNTEIIDYHFHKRLKQNTEISKEAKRELEKYGKFDSSITYSFLFNEILENSRAKNSMPSVTDIVYMVDNTLKYSQINPNGKISFKVCSDLGVAEYSLTERGRKFFKRIGRKNKFISTKGDGSLFVKIYDQEIDAIQTAREFARQISSEMFLVIFQSYEEFYSQKKR